MKRFTIVISVTVYGFVALTLTPAMNALMRRSSLSHQRGYFSWFNRQVDRVDAILAATPDQVIYEFLPTGWMAFRVLTAGLRLEREPNNPFVPVFAPLVPGRDADLWAQAPRLWSITLSIQPDAQRKRAYL